MRRAGTLKKRSLTSTLVPTAAPAGRERAAPAAVDDVISVPSSRAARPRREQRTFATEAMLGSASPRNPKRRDRREVLHASRILLVACRSSARRASVRVHAHAVVGHADARDAAVVDLHADARRLGVERVLDELLHDARRPLDDLARGNLVREVDG